MIRHIIKVKLYVVLAISFIYSSEINIPLDPIGYNNFYLNSINPKYQKDLLDREYIIEGNLGSPRSVYLLENLYSNLNDSVRTNSSLLYNQGDVGYRVLTIDIRTKVDDRGVLKLIANGLSYPGRFSQYSDSNILQNYLLHFSKIYNSSNLSFYTGYHLENSDLKYINSNSGESYLYGINYKVSNQKHETTLRYASQIGRTNFQEIVNYHITWGIFKSKYYLTENIIPYINNIYKDFYFDNEVYSFNNLSGGILFNYNLIDFDIAVNTVNSNLLGGSQIASILPDVIFKTKFDHFNLSSGVLGEYWVNPSSYNILPSEERMLNQYQYLFLNLSYDADCIELEIEPRLISEDNFNNQYFSLKNKIDINWEIFEKKIKVIPYLLSINKSQVIISLATNYYSTSTLLLNNHIVSSFKLFETESANRYLRFLGIKYSGIQFNKKYSINLDKLSLYSDKNPWIWNDNRIKNYLDFYIGMEFEKFIFSWHFTNVLSENYIINSTGSIQKLNMKYFSINWKFDN